MHVHSSIDRLDTMRWAERYCLSLALGEPEVVGRREEQSMQTTNLCSVPQIVYGTVLRLICIIPWTLT